MKQGTYSLALVLLLQHGLSTWAQPVPHHFSGITVLPDRTTVLNLEGSTSNMFNLSGIISNQFRQMFDQYIVEGSTNLADWTWLGIRQQTNSDPNPLLFHDTNSSRFDYGFYRTPTNHFITMLPSPTGPFSVGTMDRVMIDPARTNLYRYTPRTNAFMVSFWYPAEPPVAGAVPGGMWDQRLAADTSFYTTYGNDPRWAQIIPRAMGHRFVDAAMADSPARFPVILYSHGLPTFRKAGSHQAEELASHGYVVVAVDHSDCWASEFPDGRYLTGNRNGDLPGRLKDMQFLFNQLAVLDSSDPFFAGRLDLDRVGVFGGSFGGEVVETCRTNSTVKCAAICDATNLQLNTAGLQKPLLVMLGQTNAFFSEDQWLFNKATNNATWLQLRGADHATGIDWAWAGETPWGRGPALAIDACLVWFFDTYLKGEAPAFPTNPEIYNVQRK